MAWFMFPASMVVGTVLLNMTEKSSRGILKMLSLPVSAAKLCFAKFVILLALALFQILLNVCGYFISAGIASWTQGYPFVLPPYVVFKEAVLVFVAAIPMTAFFWCVSVCIAKPIFSMGIGFASIVPSVLMINTKIWFAYPVSYPFFVITAEYGKLASNINTARAELIPWVPVAAGITCFCLFMACLCFGRAERR